MSARKNDIIFKPLLDLNSPQAVIRFRELAAAVDAKRASSKEAALVQLQAEGIVDQAGILTEFYSQ
ncbi:hypothetical protein PbB2_02071 [Candidatus Phycosocius bacilliformis]|uniref:Uncharacterized protein n=1 Tax=Candidatus Phycosocius bacilliformis TaxID=1445552 RepID=A0A2P2EBE5_9PROT|nr:hypothetical protein PbB2_02071 [Candidatus Phycosocius bacilliformis]